MNMLFKYEIPRGLGTIQIPVTEDGLANILPKVIMQNGTPYLYAAVDPSVTETMDVHTLLIGTGQPLPVNYHAFDYMDTVQEGPYVWHVFILNPNIDLDSNPIDDLFA